MVVWWDEWLFFDPQPTDPVVIHDGADNIWLYLFIDPLASAIKKVLSLLLSLYRPARYCR